MLKNQELKTAGNFKDSFLSQIRGIAKVTINAHTKEMLFDPRLPETVSGFWCPGRPCVGVLTTGAVLTRMASMLSVLVEIKVAWAMLDIWMMMEEFWMSWTFRNWFVACPVIALVSGYAIGGGHVMCVVCDLTIAAWTTRSLAKPVLKRQFRWRLGLQLFAELWARKSPWDLVLMLSIQCSGSSGYGSG